MVVRLEEHQIRYAVKARQNGKGASVIASELGVSARRIRQIYAEFCDTGIVHVPQKPGRHRTEIPDLQVRAVDEAYERMHAGIMRTAKMLHNTGTEISYYAVYQIMKEHGMIVPSAARTRRRKWVRYERRYSNAMWHVDWHEMKDPPTSEACSW